MQVEEALRRLGLVRTQDGALPSPEQIRRAFKQQALIWHPDKLSRRQAADTTTSLGPDADPAPLQGQHTVLHPPPDGSTWGPSSAGGVDPGLAAGQEAGASPEQQQQQHIPHANRHQKQQQQHFSDKVHGDQNQQHQQEQHQHQGAGATWPGGTGPDSDPGETFKRLAAACHVLLQQRRKEQQQQGQAGVGGLQQGQGQEQEEREEAWLVDSLSAELLLQEAARLRLSDFDMIFLHMRAAALRGDLATEVEGSGAGAVLGVWPDAVQSIDDILRRIRIRLERRRQRQGIPSSATSRAAASSFRGPAASKWALLYDFVADMVAAPPDSDQQQQQQQQQQEGHGSGNSNGNTEGCTEGTWGKQQQRDMGLHVGMAGGGGVPVRKRGPLPRGFYLTWLRRLVVARIVWGFIRR